MNKDITVILNAYRRPYNLAAQIEAIRNQTIKPKEIWIWVNQHEDNDGFDFKSLGADVVVHASRNFKYIGRFTLGLLVQDGYLAYFDDDTIPGSKWFENCFQTLDIPNVPTTAILGGAGVILQNPFNYMQHIRVGWPSQNEQPSYADLVGHAWFFSRNTLNALFKATPYNYENGEDIQLSQRGQAHGYITLVPPHPANDKEMWSSLRAVELGDDDKASSNGKLMPYETFCLQRNICIAQAIREGWIPLGDQAWTQQMPEYRQKLMEFLEGQKV